jgi:hypothetical protein
MVYFIIISILISIINLSTSVPIGGNLEGVRDHSRSLQYVNLIRQARQWGNPNTPWHGNASLSDPITGWPISDFGVQISSGAVDMGGTYLLHAKGNANVSLMGGSEDSIKNKTYNATTNTLTAFVTVREGATDLVLIFRNTTGPGLQNISLLQPGYNLSSQSNISNLMLVHLSRLNVIRFMDWTDTNLNFEVNWNDTTPLNWPLYHPPKHNPWQTIPYIMNQFNKSIDAWINCPHNVSDDYIINLARLMLNELNPRSNIYVEYSNEVWNNEFPQSRDNVNAANDSVHNHGDPFHFTYDNSTDVFTWALRRIAYQTKHISDLFKTVFGEENVGQWKRVRPILAGQADTPRFAIEYLEYLNNIYGPPRNFIHGIAIAPYFSLGPYKMWSNLTVDQVLDGLNISLQKYLPEQGWSQQGSLGVHATYAAWYQVPVHAYEGGPDTVEGCGNCSLEAKINATRHARMTDVCVTFLNGWYRFGFQTFNWYTAGATAITQYGSFSLLEDMRQETLIDTTKMFNSTSPVAQLPRPSPKLKAIDIIRESSIELTFGIPIPSYNVNATNYMNHPVPYRYPDLRNLSVNSTFYYPLQVFQSPIQINLTIYVAGNSSVLEASINNDQFIQVQTPKTANTTTFEAAPTMQFRINQTILPSIVTLRLKNIEIGYSIRSFDVILTGTT